MIHLNIDRPYRSLKLDKHLIKAAETALQHQRYSESYELSIVITGDAQLKRLNSQFRKEDNATDVLSFPAERIDPQTGRRYLGDVVISVPRARIQARTGGHTLEAELQLLAIHGILHLLGHDHSEEPEKARMWIAENEILDILGLSIRAEQAEKAYSDS